MFAIVHACSSTPLPPPEPVAEDAAIRFTISSDPQLNLYNEKPHSLLCCVYQLSNLNKFNQLAGDKSGMYTLGWR